MRQVKSTAIVVGILMAPLLAGCAAERPAAKTCEAEIHLTSEPQPLGSSKALLAEFKTAGSGQQATLSLGEVTHAAGWSDDWDTLINASSNMDDEWLNNLAQTPSGTCWTGLPSGINSDAPPTGYYVFLKDRQVVQSVTWDTGVRLLRFHSDDRLTHESMLNAKGGGLTTY